MKFHQLRAKNFGPFKDEAVLELSGQGMILILGNNHDEYDSNGSGKSTLLEAFTWCIWGKPLRKIDADAVINRFVGQDCSVSVTFSDESEYVITRTRGMTGGKKSNDLTFTIDGVDATTGGMKVTQDRINKAIGLDFDTFRIMMPGAGLKAGEMTDKAIKELLEDLLQTGVVSEAMELAKVEAKRLDAELRAVDLAIAKLNEVRSTEMSRYYDYLDRDKNFDEEKDQKILTIQTDVAAQMNVVSTSEKVAKKWAEDKKKLDEYKLKLVEAVKARKELGEQVKEAMAARLASVSHQDKMIDRHSGKEIALREARNKALSLEAVCTVCAQCVSDDHKEKMVSEAEAVLRQSEQRGDMLTAAKNILMQEHTERVNVISDKYNACDAVEKSLEKQIWELQKGESDYKVASERWKTAKARIKQLSDEQWEIQQKTSPFKDLISVTWEKVNQVQAEGTELVVKRTEIAEEKESYDFWVDAFGPSGLRSYMLEHVTPVLNARAKYYSDLVTQGNMQVIFNTKTTLDSGEVREKFNIEVLQKFGGQSYGACSAGEKARADLIIAFALGDLASLRANKIVPFRFLDEPFESMDDSGTESVVRLLNDQREKFNTVYVITHKDHFKQLFKNTLTVTKKDGCSTLEYNNGDA